MLQMCKQLIPHRKSLNGFQANTSKTVQNSFSCICIGRVCLFEVNLVEIDLVVFFSVLHIDITMTLCFIFSRGPTSNISTKSQILFFTINIISLYTL